MLKIHHLTKCFGNHRAIDAVDLEVKAGEVMAVVGENGAGKSTLMRLLAGAILPDSGSIELDLKQYCPRHPAMARHAGVALVPQEAELVPHLNIAENIGLGVEPTRWGCVDRSELERRATNAFANVIGDQPPSDLRRLARELGPSERQRVVIARALAQPTLRLIIFDEPTSSLSRADVKRLFATILRLKQRGLAILYVSHFLEEVLTVADRYAVLRDGRIVGSGLTAETTASAIVALMAGVAPGERQSRRPRLLGTTLLEVEGLTGRVLPHPVSLRLRAGEVLGIAGLVGAGRTELLRTIFGLEPATGGRLRLAGEQGPLSPGQCLKRGLGLLSEDRRDEGLAQGLGIAQNITLSKLPRSGPFVSRTRQRRVCRPLVDRLRIRCRDLEQPVSELSGGNQQKVALGRLLHHDVQILLLDEPTRGIDVRSRADVHRTIDELAQRGKAILLVSSYLPELLELSDRIAVMYRGHLGEPRAASDWDEHSLLLAATGTT